MGVFIIVFYELKRIEEIRINVLIFRLEWRWGINKGRINYWVQTDNA